MIRLRPSRVHLLDEFLTLLGERHLYLEEVTANRRGLSVATPTETDEKPIFDPEGGHSKWLLRCPSGSMRMVFFGPVVFTEFKPPANRLNPYRDKSMRWRSARSVDFFMGTSGVHETLRRLSKLFQEMELPRLRFQTQARSLKSIKKEFRIFPCPI